MDEEEQLTNLWWTQCGKCETRIEGKLNAPSTKEDFVAYLHAQKWHYDNKGVRCPKCA